jgi:mono/diheme cytochrome c family protein
VVNKEKARAGMGSLRNSSVIVTFAFVLWAAVGLSPIPATAHTPITTKVRFNKEVIRIFQRNCLGCHRPGGIAFSLATYDEARPWAKAIKEELLQKRMPPWLAVRGYGEFRNVPPLTQRDIDLIINWVEGGAPKGEETDLPPGALYPTNWKLGQPDLVLSTGVDIKVAPGGEEYREFQLDPNLTQDRWVSAIDLMPGADSVVHCATIRIKPTNSATRVLTSWMPGQKPVPLTPPAAQRVPAGSKLLVRVHYRGSDEPQTDRSQVGLYFTRAATPKPLQELAIADARAAIPAGNPRYKASASLVVQSDLDAVGLRPLTNPLIVSTQVTAYRPDGTEEVLIWTLGYQFDWQQTYYFKRPVALPKGTRIEVISYFDNSDGNRNNPNDPPKELRWSDLTNDPLCSVLAVTRDAGE